MQSITKYYRAGFSSVLNVCALLCKLFKKKSEYECVHNDCAQICFKMVANSQQYVSVRTFKYTDAVCVCECVM